MLGSGGRGGVRVSFRTSCASRDTRVSHLTDELDVRRRAAEGFGEDVEVEGFSDVPVRRRQILQSG